MLQNLRDKLNTRQLSYVAVLGVISWTILSFGVAQLVVVALVWGYVSIIQNEGILSAPLTRLIVTAIVYTLTLVIAIGVPVLVHQRKTTLTDLGMTRVMSWIDILVAPAAFVVYALLSWLLIQMAIALIPGFDVTQVQDVGFSNLGGATERAMAFVALVVIAPVAEELIFRGYLYGRLRKITQNAVVAGVIVSCVFATAHMVPVWQPNVGIDVFALSLVLCLLREKTGSIWAGVLLHMIKNALAFFLLFIIGTGA